MSRKGFTLIELLTVIAVLGILVLIAAPKFLGYTAEAKLAQIKNDIKVHENLAAVILTENPETEFKWTALSEQEVQTINESAKALNKKGQIVTDLIGGENYVLELKEVNSKLKGQFIWTNNDEVIYYDENLNIPLKVGNNDENSKGEQLPKFAPDSDFLWVEDLYGGGYSVEGEIKGYYKYIGTGEEVVHIPNEIKGHPMKSYYRMFYGTGADVKKVVSTNPNVTNMIGMFYTSQATSLDLSDFDTSSVTTMNSMFNESQITELNISNFDTSNVTTMNGMFKDSLATSLDLSSFDTSNVANMGGMFWNSHASTLELRHFDTSNATNMGSMFSGTHATSLDLSSFDTFKVANMSDMFSKSQAIELDLSSFDTSNVAIMFNMFKDSNATTGYAKTQTDADKLNASSNKPTGLTFITK